MKIVSRRFNVRGLTEQDVPVIYDLCRQNPLYYHHCPPFVTEESIRQDLQALPPNKTMEDKFYLGWFDGEKLIAVMDLIRAYPDPQTYFIGFFMVDASAQGQEIGSGIIEECCEALAAEGARAVRLGWVEGNPQAAHFWHKNHFTETGVVSRTEEYTIILAEREL